MRGSTTNSPPLSAHRSPTAVVIGGGISGLATAALLARDGYRVDLVEAREQLGGRAGSWEQDGFRFDTGPSWYLMPEVFDHFFRLLGTSAAEQLDLQVLDPGYRVFFEGHQDSLDIRASAARNADAFERIEPGAGLQLAKHLDSAARTYDMALGRFLYTSFSSLRPFLSPAVVLQAPQLLKLLAEPLERLVARRFQDPRLRQVLGYPAVFLGSSPDRAPSMYHLMSALDLTGGVQYPQGGFARLIEAITALTVQQGVQVHTSTRATRILTTLDGPATSGLDHDSGSGLDPDADADAHADASLDQPVRGGDHTRGVRRGSRDWSWPRRRPSATGVEVQTADGSTRTLRADVVVATADLHRVETTLLPRTLQTFPETWWKRRTAGPGAVLAMLGVEGELPQLAHHSLLFARDWKENFSALREGRVPSPASAYVCRPSATDPSVAPAGHENLFLLVPVPADPGLGRGGLDGGGSAAVEQVADDAIAMLAEHIGVPDLASRIVVRRTVGPAEFSEDLGAWQGSMLGPAHTLRQSAFFRAGNASKKVDSLLYAGSSTIPGIGLPMCLISAELVAKRLRGDRSASPLPEPEPAAEGARA